MPKAGYAEWDEDDGYDADDERPLRRARRPLSWLRLALLSSLSIAGLVYLARLREDPGPSDGPMPIPASVLVAPAPVWRPLPPYPALYALERGPVTPEARQHANGNREDTLTLGRLDQALHARIVLAQGFGDPPRSLFVDVARRAAESGLSVVRNGQSRVVATKFGMVETAAVTLAGAAERDCQAFRFTDPEAGFGFLGWLCGSGPGDRQVACLIDGIALAGATGPGLKALFVRAERNRVEACAPGARTASIGLKPPP